MRQRQDISFQATGLMALICLTWALGQVILKYTAADMAPTLQIAIRSAGAAILTWIFVYWRGRQLFTLAGAWRPGLLVGALFAGEFFFVGEALRYTTASHVSIFLYTAPIFAALGLHVFLPEERLRPVQWAGVLLAFIGVAISFLARDHTINTDTSPNMLWGDTLAVMAGVLWGATTVVVRGSRLKNVPATETLFYQLVGAFVLLFLGAGMTNQLSVQWTTALVIGLIFQIFILSFMSLLIWFWLLRQFLASRLGVLSFMTPLFGVLLGVFILNEPLENSFVLGAVCVVMGLVLVSGYDWLFRSKQASPTSTVASRSQDS